MMHSRYEIIGPCMVHASDAACEDTPTAPEKTIFAPLQGRYTYKQLRFLPVRMIAVGVSTGSCCCCCLDS